MILGKKIELHASHDDELCSFFSQCSGVDRFIYNYSLNLWQQDYQAWKKDKSLEKPSMYSISRKLTILRNDPKYSWLKKVSRYVMTDALGNLEDAFRRFWRGQNKCPKFKKKTTDGSFGVANSEFKISKTSESIKIGKCKKWIRLKQPLKIPTKDIKAIRISNENTRWFISINYEDHVEEPKGVLAKVFTSLKEIVQSKLKAVGIDFGVEVLAMLSTGKAYENLKVLNKYEKRIKKAQRKVSLYEAERRKFITKIREQCKKEGRRMKKEDYPSFSRNHKKWQKILRKLHSKVKNTRLDYIHKFTTNIINKFDIICLETLNLEGLLKNHKLAKALSDVSLSEVKRQIEYKALRAGKLVVSIDQFFPSTKLCRKCLLTNEMTLSDRTFLCEECLHKENRDLNAARNILNEGLVKITTLGRRGIACGDVASTSEREIYLPIRKQVTSEKHKKSSHKVSS
jgi:putative transposase